MPPANCDRTNANCRGWIFESLIAVRSANFEGFRGIYHIPCTVLAGNADLLSSLRHLGWGCCDERGFGDEVQLMRLIFDDNFEVALANLLRALRNCRLRTSRQQVCRSALTCLEYQASPNRFVARWPEEPGSRFLMLFNFPMWDSLLILLPQHFDQFLYL